MRRQVPIKNILIDKKLDILEEISEIKTDLLRCFVDGRDAEMHTLKANILEEKLNFINEILDIMEGKNND